MSVSGKSETQRAHMAESVGTGGGSPDMDRVEADEDREIVAVQLDDTGGEANVAGELSFSSTSAINNVGDDDAARSSVIVMGGQGPVVTGLSITWNAGEEVHLHGRNNSANVERIFATIYYRELE